MSSASPADYEGGCIANLASAVASRFGARPAISPLRPSLDRATGLSDRLNAARTVFLVVLDGVGTRQLSSHCPNGALAAHQQSTLTSVFPSSTAPAITSLLTASAPATHANPAWYAHLPDVDRVVRTLPMNVRGYPAESVPDDLWSWQGWTSRVQSSIECTAFQPRAIFDSAYSCQALAGCERIAYDDPAELVALVAAIAKQRSSVDRFVYIYLPHFDSIAHDFGWQSDQARDCLQGFDVWFEQCQAVLSGSEALMLVLADHGFVDIAPECQHRLNDFPCVEACLEAPLAGEPRTVFCRVAPGREQAFFKALQRCLLGQVCRCAKTADLVTAGWFGPLPHADFAARCGTHVLLMNDGHTLIDHMENERPLHFIGMHGGMAIDEMQVPLIVVGVN